MRRKEFWLITTDHLENRLLFRDAEDFCVAMTYVAVQAHKCGVFVLAFILMSNHVHFVLAGSRAQVDAFMKGFKAAYSQYYETKYGTKELLRRNYVDVQPVPVEDEGLEWAVAYVQMNCVAAGICAWPNDYPWGTGNCFFAFPAEGLPAASGGGAGGSARGVRGVGATGGVRGGGAGGTVRDGGLSGRGGRPVGSLSARERLRILHTRAALPAEWRVTDYGYIAPESFVRWDWVERLYRTPRRMNFFLQHSSKAKERLASGKEGSPSFRDQSILAVLPDLCQSLFREKDVNSLNEKQLVKLMRQIRYRFSANVHQIARVTGVSYERAAELLDRA